MKLDRLVFLALTTSLAACAAAETDDLQASEGAVVDGQCVAPGADSSTFASDDARACETLATKASAMPAAHDFGSVQGLCVGFLSSFKATPAESARKCILALDPQSDDLWTGLYGCGYSALGNTCSDPDVASSCKSILANPGSTGTQSGSKDLAANQVECETFLSGLEKDARTDAIACAKSGPFSIFSCVESIEPHIGRACTSPGSDPSRQLEIEARSRCTREVTAGAPRDLCTALVANAQPNVLQAIADEVHRTSVDANGDPRTMTEKEVLAIGVKAMRAACRQPTEVDALCAEGVGSLVGHGASNAGGRLTNECRSVFAGLTPQGRRQMTLLMSAIQNGAEVTKRPGWMSNLLRSLLPCPSPAAGICVDDAEG